MKEYIVKRHYTIKHSSQFDKIVGQARENNKIEHLKKSIEKQQGVFTTYKLCECMAEKGKSFSDREFIKNCLTIFTEYACPEKKYSVKQTSTQEST